MVPKIYFLFVVTCVLVNLWTFNYFLTCWAKRGSNFLKMRPGFSTFYFASFHDLYKLVQVWESFLWISWCVVESEGCTASEFVQHHHGGTCMQDMIACFWTKTLPYRVLWACMLCRFAYFFLSSIIEEVTPVRWCSGSYLSVITHVRTQACGWWNLTLIIVDSE